MKPMLAKIGLAVALSSVSCSFLALAQARAVDVSLPQGWYVHSTKPRLQVSTRQCADYGTDYEWLVSKGNGGVKIELRKDVEIPQPELPPKFPLDGRDDREGSRSVMPFGDGFLVGFDMGEFGGALWHSNRDGSKIERLVAKNVRGIVKMKDRYFVIAGLAHLGSDRGAVFQVFEKSGKVWITELIDLQSAPNAFARESDQSVLIVTNHHLWRIHNDGRAGLLAIAPVGGLYPSSMVIAEDESVYVAMRFFVLRFVKRAPEVTFP